MSYRKHYPIRSSFRFVKRQPARLHLRTQGTTRGNALRGLETEMVKEVVNSVLKSLNL